MIADLKTYLAASTDIANLIDDRIERQYVRQDTEYPHLLLTALDDTPPLYHLSGEPDISEFVVQIDAYAIDDGGPNGALVAQQLADAVRNRISGYRGAMGNTNVRSCTMLRSNMLDEEPEAGEQGRVHRVSMDFQIKYQRTVPDFT